MKNLIYSISEKLSNGSYRNILSVSRLHKLGYLPSVLQDGEYPFIIQENCWFASENLPKHDRMEIIRSEPFSLQVLRGVFRIQDGKIDLKHLDKQIPAEYYEYQDHIFLEQMELQPNGEYRFYMGS